MISRTADCAAPGQTNRKSVLQPSEGEVAVLVTSRQGNVAIAPELLLTELLRLHPRRGSSSTATACTAAAGHWARTSRFVSSPVPTGSMSCCSWMS